jgi:hypothetical protein
VHAVGRVNTAELDTVVKGCAKGGEGLAVLVREEEKARPSVEAHRAL